jgi:hypothetical protein
MSALIQLKIAELLRGGKLIFPRKLPLLEKPSPKPSKRTQVPQQARTVAIMPNDVIRPPRRPLKTSDITSVRIPLQTLLSQTRKAREHMTTEHTVVRSGKLKRKAFNSNVAGHLLTIATFGFTLAYRATRHSLPRRQLALLDLARQRQRLADRGALMV